MKMHMFLDFLSYTIFSSIRQGKEGDMHDSIEAGKPEVTGVVFFFFLPFTL